jgi:hypothetical protein
MCGKQRYVSDELTHFVGRNLPSDQARYELLVRILSEVEDNREGHKLHIKHADYEPGTSGSIGIRPDKRLADNELFSPQMTCYCDIPLEDLHIHMAKYSRFGIAWHKDFMVERGANPVIYMSKDSHLTDHRYNVRAERIRRREKFFNEVVPEWLNARMHAWQGLGALKNGRLDQQKLTGMENAILSYFLGYVVFFDANLPEDHKDNFYMEREWRLLGHLAFNISDVSRIILPTEFASPFRRDIPQYAGSVHLV